MALAMEAQEGFRSLWLLAFRATGDLDFTHCVFELCFPVEVSMDVVVSFFTSSGSVDRAER